MISDGICDASVVGDSNTKALLIKMPGINGFLS